MIDPAIALLIALLLGSIAALIWWPGKGLIARWRRARHMTTQVLREDVLKHIHKLEMKSRRVTLDSIAGAIGLSRNATAVLLHEMQQKQLVTLEGDTIRLTPNGRDIALHIIRAHRLWEHYLAEETGYTAAEWHTRAEEQEHALSPEALDQLATRLGNPSHDPHGDPIPTGRGALVPHGGIALTQLPVDARARIVHLEDEPDVVYAQLVAEGLYPGQTLRLTERTAGRVRFWAGGDEHTLAPLVAANIAVLPLEDPAQNGSMQPTPRLSELPLGSTAVVRGIARQCRGAERRRLLDLGIVPGTAVRAELRSPGGEPTAYLVRGTLIALRSEQAELIELEAPAAVADAREEVART